MTSMITAEEAAVTSEYHALESGLNAAVLTGKRVQRRGLRVFGLCIVLAVAFSGFLLSSTFVFTGSAMPGPGEMLTYRFVNALTIEVVALGLLYYVVLQNGCRLTDLGFAFRRRDLADGAGLIVGSAVLTSIAGYFIFWAYQLALKHPATRPQIPGQGVVSFLTVLLVLVNPFFEELIGRAFTISEIRALGGTRALAVAVSVGLQTSYHLYQGVPYALTTGIMFLLYSIYYIRSGRIVPVIIAHMWSDFAGLILYPLILAHH